MMDEVMWYCRNCGTRFSRAIAHVAVNAALLAAAAVLGLSVLALQSSVTDAAVSVGAGVYEHMPGGQTPAVMCNWD